VFIDGDGALHNPEHEHLDKATIGFAWATEENSRNGRRILGLTELMPPMAMGKWSRARALEQMADWFGDVPDFLITIDVVAASFDDASFCALIEHELYHCAQQRDAFGNPKFTARPATRCGAFAAMTSRSSSASSPAMAPRRPGQPSS
jgi:hypothetical protein